MPWKIEQHQLILELRRFVFNTEFIYLYRYILQMVSFYVVKRWQKHAQQFVKAPTTYIIQHVTVIVAEAKFYILNHVFVFCQSFHIESFFWGQFCQKMPKDQYLVQLIKHPMLRIPNFNFPNSRCCKVFFFLFNTTSYSGIFGCILILI